MFQVRKMEPEDFPFALSLANTMNWNMTADDFAFNLQLEPNGCLLLVKDKEPLGLGDLHQLRQSRLVWQPHNPRDLQKTRRWNPTCQPCSHIPQKERRNLHRTLWISAPDELLR